MKKVILLTILVFSLITTGCINQKSEVRNRITENRNVSPEIIVDEQPEINNDKQPQTATTSTTQNIQGTEDWRVYEKKDQNVRIKYHKNWYYDRDEQAEKELGYDLHIGFAESPEILAQNKFFYSIDFIIADKDVEWKYSGYLKVIATRDNKQYILRTGTEDVYGDILDKMAGSFEFLNE